MRRSLELGGPVPQHHCQIDVVVVVVVKVEIGIQALRNAVNRSEFAKTKFILFDHFPRNIILKKTRKFGSVGRR